MSTHIQIIERLFSSYQALDHDAMAECYHEEATFRDIAFRLKGRKKIHAMWALICENGITVTVQSVEEAGDVVRTRIRDEYIYSDTKRPVDNEIESTFRFAHGLIIEQVDACDALGWARQAYWPGVSEIVGRCEPMRRLAAFFKIRKSLAKHPNLR